MKVHSSLVLTDSTGPLLLPGPSSVPRTALRPKVSRVWGRYKGTEEGPEGKGKECLPLTESSLPPSLTFPSGPALYALSSTKQNNYCSQESNSHSETPRTCPGGLSQSDLTQRPTVIYTASFPAAFLPEKCLATTHLFREGSGICPCGWG